MELYDRVARETNPQADRGFNLWTSLKDGNLQLTLASTTIADHWTLD